MRLTNRGYVVVGSFFAFILLALSVLIGRYDAMEQCAKFQANNDWQAASDAACPFTDKDGNHLYTWEP